MRPLLAVGFAGACFLRCWVVRVRIEAIDRGQNVSIQSMIRDSKRTRISWAWGGPIGNARAPSPTASASTRTKRLTASDGPSVSRRVQFKTRLRQHYPCQNHHPAAACTHFHATPPHIQDAQAYGCLLSNDIITGMAAAAAASTAEPPPPIKEVVVIGAGVVVFCSVVCICMHGPGRWRDTRSRLTAHFGGRIAHPQASAGCAWPTRSGRRA